jgi:histidine triad (HIT) family protein
MADCLFCKIIARQVDAAIVHEDDRALAFRDIHPVAPTHVLIIPKKHIASIDEVAPEDEAEMGHLYRVASTIAAQEKLGSGYRVVMNCGADAGQSVFHVHLHLVGGKPLGWPPFPRG